MAGHLTYINGSPCFLDYPDGYGSAIVDGRKWEWDFSEYGGPTFLKKDGEPRKNQFPTNKKVWAAFNEWFQNYQLTKQKSSVKIKENES